MRRPLVGIRYVCVAGRRRTESVHGRHGIVPRDRRDRGTVAAVAGGRGLFLPVVVLELVLGVVIGPQGLDIAHVNDFTQFFSDLGLGMLFFFAGYEIDGLGERAARRLPARVGV